MQQAMLHIEQRLLITTPGHDLFLWGRESEIIRLLI